MRGCKYCGATSEDPNEIWAGICRACYPEVARRIMGQRPQGQAIIEPALTRSEPKPEPEEAPMDPVDGALRKIRGLLK